MWLRSACKLVGLQSGWGSACGLFGSTKRLVWALNTRSVGGFRLYSKGDVGRFLLIKQMKPLDFSVEEIGNVLSTLDDLDDESQSEPKRAELVDRLAVYHELVEQRITALLAQVESAEDFAERLRREITQQRAVGSK